MGLLAFRVAAAIAMGILGDRLRGRDVAVGIVLSLALGFACSSSTSTRDQSARPTTRAIPSSWPISFPNSAGVSA